MAVKTCSTIRTTRIGISRLGYHFIAGVLAHLPGLLALTAPSYNSFRRLQPHFWSSAYTAWGPDNREAAVRVASGKWGREASHAQHGAEGQRPQQQSVSGPRRRDSQPAWTASHASLTPAKHPWSTRAI